MADPVLGGRYRIVRHLARGGMAEVYLGHDQLLDRPVAVKVLFPELARDASFVERFRREAQSAGRLNHPNIVSVYDFGEDDDAYFIVMEYVPGQTLSDIIAAQSPMLPSRAVEIGADIAAGLAAAHQEGIIHRDVKPANVLIAAGAAKVADFGIARAADARADLTMPGSVIGTATYLSPEQARGLAVDRRADVYSLGLVLYEMLTGQPPFRGDSPVAVAYKQQHETPAPPSALNPAVPPWLDAVVARAMSFEPDGRPASAEELRADLLDAGPGPVAAEPTVAFGAAPTTVFPATAVGGAAPGGGGAATAMLPRPPAGGGGPSRSREPGAVYRRRRVVVAGLLALLLLGALVAVLALSTGGKKTTALVLVPPVRGLAPADAMATLDHAGLKSQVIEQSRPGPPNQVLDQLPVAGAQVSRGTLVSLFVASAATTTSTPSSTRATTRTTTTTGTTTPASTTPAPATTTFTTIPGTTIPGTTSVVTTIPSGTTVHHVP